MDALLIAVEIRLYSPNRPVVDYSAIFLWLMAVLTIICASIWGEFIACERADERYNHLMRKVFQLISLFIQRNIFSFRVSVSFLDLAGVNKH